MNTSFCLHWGQHKYALTFAECFLLHCCERFVVSDGYIQEILPFPQFLKIMGEICAFTLQYKATSKFFDLDDIFKWAHFRVILEWVMHPKTSLYGPAYRNSLFISSLPQHREEGIIYPLFSSSTNQRRSWLVPHFPFSSFLSYHRTCTLSLFWDFQKSFCRSKLS